MFSARISIFIAVMILHAAASAGINVNFEDLTLPDNESAWSGDYPVDGIGGTGTIRGFSSGPAEFLNFSDGDWAFWEGFSYSNMSDTADGGYQNQFSAYPGSGIDAGDDIYAVGYVGYSLVPTVKFGVPTQVLGAYVTTTTYSALAMLTGNQFAKKFGGPAGLDPDWCRLTVTGWNSAGAISGSVGCLLADYTFPEADLDYVLDRWQYVDLTSLGQVVRIEFSMDSTDSGPYGMNTPAYFAIDGLTLLPEPSSVLLLAGGFLWLRRGRRNSSRRDGFE